MSNKKFAGILAATLLLLCTPGSIRAEQQQETIITDTYTTTDANEKKDYPAEREFEGEKYVLKEVIYEVTKEEPILEKQEITETVSMDVISKDAADFDSNIVKTFAGQEQALSLDKVVFNPKKLPMGNGKADLQVTETYSDTASIPEQKEVDYTDPTTGVTVKVQLARNEVKELSSYEDTQIQMTFYVIDAPYFILGDARIPNAGEEPSVMGYEDLYLSYLGLSSDYQITGAAWAGDAYMLNGESCRDAVCYVQRYIPVYEVTYGSSEVVLPEIDGYEAVATYSADVDVETGEVEYTIQASAVYSLVETGISAVQIVVISLGVLVMGLIVLLILYSISKKRKKSQEI